MKMLAEKLLFLISLSHFVLNVFFLPPETKKVFCLGRQESNKEGM